MSIFEIDPLGDPRWNVFTRQHPAASVFHRAEWLQALKATYGYRPLALCSNPPDTPLVNALLLCEVRSLLTGNRFVSLPFSDHCEPLVDNADEADLLVNALAHRTEAKHLKYAELRPILRGPRPLGLLGISSSYFFHRLDLRRTEGALFKSFHKDCVQRKVRRAERESLRCEEGTSETMLQHFYKLFVITRRRQRLPPQPLKWFRSLIANMGKDLKIYTAFKDDIPVASILVVTDKKTIVYKYGCSDARFNNLGGTPLLFWNAITEAKANGIEELDMGRTDTDNPGLVAFKEHWGAQRSTLNYWRYPARPAVSRSGIAVEYARRVMPYAHDKALILLGRLLYRHVG